MKDKGKEIRRGFKKVILVSKIARGKGVDWWKEIQTLLSAYYYTNPIFQFPKFHFSTIERQKISLIMTLKPDFWIKLLTKPQVRF